MPEIRGALPSSLLKESEDLALPSGIRIEVESNGVVGLAPDGKGLLSF